MRLDKFDTSKVSRLKILISDNELRLKPITVFQIATPLKAWQYKLMVRGFSQTNKYNQILLRKNIKI